MAQDYNNTLNLPVTEFNMRGALPQREPAWVEEWEEKQLYHKMIKKNEGKPQYILHDGPPYANGDIHLGTALNKVLKDFIIRQKNMSGYQAPYIPGWDTHGLPIELKARKKAGVSSDIGPVELRKICKEFALHYLDSQRTQFKRLGTLGEWENPYMTLKPEFEAKQIEIFGNMAQKGYIYKGLKPVYWCPDCNTALAEAEIEYEEDPCFSIYVKFPVKDDQGKLGALGVDPAKTFFVIWTTTTWTLPGNMAVCLGPDYEYCAVHANGEYYIMAKELADAAMKAAKIEDYELIGSVKGKDLEYIVCAHPFLDRDSLVIVGDHVTLDSGTGCVHTAPGHGVEDFEVCVNHYPQIPIVVPVDNVGKLTKDAGEFEGLTTDEANKAIAKKLEDSNLLFAVEKIVHQYPHCWRCKHPIIYRATEQWFCSVEDFKEDAVREIEKIKWIPGWGEGRIKNMVTDRSDWCISRQRLWGVPIPIFYCEECGEFHIDEQSVKAVSDLFRKEGSDAWWTHEAEEILPKGTKCKKCGCEKFRKETDIMDVWFDSGSSHEGVLRAESEDLWPADLYLEGSDQHRGWFNSSLCTSVAVYGQAPYKGLLTHGFLVDEKGNKMSKSKGNGVDPKDVIKQNGADILRLWVASSDYRSDVSVSHGIIKQVADAYRKIRNTFRFMLGNISDFDVRKDRVAYNDLPELDRWMMGRFVDLVKRAKDSYNAYDFHVIYRSIFNFCNTDLSAVYFSIIKDRLYSSKVDDPARRACQTVLYDMCLALDVILSPILSFTTEEVFRYIDMDNKPKSVQLCDWPEFDIAGVDAGLDKKWSALMDFRNEVMKPLETARKDKKIGNSLDAKVTLYLGAGLEDIKAALGDMDMAPEDFFIVSQLVLGDIANAPADAEKSDTYENLAIKIDQATGHKCARCWKYSDTVGDDGLCERCASVLA